MMVAGAVGRLGARCGLFHQLQPRPPRRVCGAGRAASSNAGLSVSAIISVRGLTKTYASGFQALKSVDLDIRRGEIFALLGPNGAGKTTLINIVCGLVRPTSGAVLADGHDIVRDYRAARSAIGLVPQEISTEGFETVWSAMKFSQGLYGRPRDRGHLERVLQDLSLWDKRDSLTRTLSGGMKRRVMIAKALAHQPRILFLDEPTAGVDVDLRRDMWALVRRLRESGVTIILTTHYIEEAEEMADRVGVINHGELILVQDKSTLMRTLGKRQLILELAEPIAALPPALAGEPLEIAEGGASLVYTFDPKASGHGASDLMRRLIEAGIAFKNVVSSESSLEEIFVDLVRAPR
jgi:ABC-2 type transport system ATP-binding protein